MTADDGFAGFLAELVTAFPAAAGRGKPIAVGWGTVELERASRDFRSRWPDLGSFEPASGEPLLGASVVVSVGDGRPAFALLEPVTEGRLTATLARHGEGPVAVWIVTTAGLDPDDRPDPGDTVGSARAGPLRSDWLASHSRRVDGPFGPEALLPGGPITGPHVLLVDGPAGTIDR